MALLTTAGTAVAKPNNGRQVHVVYEGQRLGSIAKRYNVSIEALCQANGIQRRDPIRPGQRLEIPSRAEARKLEAEPATSAKPSDAADTSDKASSDEKPAKSAEAKVTKTGSDDSKSNTAVPKLMAVSPAPAPKLKGGTDKGTLTKATALQSPPETSAASASKSTHSKFESTRPATTATPSTEASPATAVPSNLVGPLATGLSHKVKAGDSLISIAKRYDTNVKTLLQVNNLKRDKVIRVGQVLVLPRPAASAWWSKFAQAPKRAGEIEVFAQTHRWKGKLVVNGKVQASGRAAVSRLLGATGGAPPVPERLLQLLSHVSDVFGGRPVRLVSGYRTNSYFKDSRHRHSSAIDFSIPGVPNSAIRDYMLQLGNVGVGYYPNSSFVHLDVRARSAYWVDYAGPGEAPRKRPGDTRLAANTRKSKGLHRVRLRRTFGNKAHATRELAALEHAPTEAESNDSSVALEDTASTSSTSVGPSGLPVQAPSLPPPGPSAVSLAPAQPTPPSTPAPAAPAAPVSPSTPSTSRAPATQSAPITQATPSQRVRRGS